MEVATMLSYPTFGIRTKPESPTGKQTIPNGTQPYQWISVLRGYRHRWTQVCKFFFKRLFPRRTKTCCTIQGNDRQRSERNQNLCWHWDGIHGAKFELEALIRSIKMGASFNETTVLRPQQPSFEKVAALVFHSTNLTTDGNRLFFW